METSLKMTKMGRMIHHFHQRCHHIHQFRRKKEYKKIKCVFYASSSIDSLLSPTLSSSTSNNNNNMKIPLLNLTVHQPKDMHIVEKIYFKDSKSINHFSKCEKKTRQLKTNGIITWFYRKF